MKPVILYRKTNPACDMEELSSISNAGFDLTFNRTTCSNNLVVSRYSCLPYYKELEDDLSYRDSKLINSYEQHNYIADFDYYYDLKDLTFQTWFSFTDIPSTEQGPFVVRGRTNSRKKQWNKLMFAPDRKEAVRIQCELFQDPFIGTQGLVFRKYIPLKKLGEGINGQPWTNEWRFFFLGTTELYRGYYWYDDTLHLAGLTSDGIALAHEAAKIISKKCNFFAVDIAEEENGKWWVVEINDGQMSGIPTDSSQELYRNLYASLKA